VTNIPGTTRDTRGGRATLGGVLLRLIDTAGLRDSYDLIERMGVERSRAAVAEAELVLLVIDGAQALGEEDERAIVLARTAPRCICVVNKSDLPLAVELDGLRALFPHVCVVSAATGRGLRELEEAVSSLFPPGARSDYGRLLTNARQGEAALRARERVCAAAAALAAGYSPDAVLTDVEEALSALGELTGKTVREDIVARILSASASGNRGTEAGIRKRRNPP
jgi:tRNA modification GTPase